jgi:Papain family cysteine protease
MGQHTDADHDGVADSAEATNQTDFTMGVEPVDGQYFHLLEQNAGPHGEQLGRHVLHDDASRAYDAADDVRTVTKQVTTLHKRIAPIWDQGQIGSCTANAALGTLMTEPFYNGKWAFAEPDCVSLYEQETKTDDAQIPGHYPPDDTGSTGLWSMKTLKAAGYITSYKHAFSFDTLCRLLQLSPVSIGIPWYQSMFTPTSRGVIPVDPASGLAGGHQLSAVGVDYEREGIKIANSWGESWGVEGYGWFRFADMQALLKAHGDVSVPVIA